MNTLKRYPLTIYLAAILAIAGAITCPLFAVPELTNTEATNIDTAPERTAWKTALELENVGNILNKYDGTVAPTANDDSGDGYSVGSVWFDTVGGDQYYCSDATLAAAVWERIQPDSELGTIAGQDASSVAITGGSITGITDLAVSGDLTVDTSTLKVDSANNWVGIGTASPSSTLDINGTISFEANSGTWDGATIAGAQTFTGQLEATGQAATTDDSLMTRGLTVKHQMFSPNIMTLPALAVANSGSGSAAVANGQGLGWAMLDPGTAVGTYAYATYAANYTFNVGSGSGVDFSQNLYFSGSFSFVGDNNAGAECVHRFLVGCDATPTMLADQDAFSDEGVGFEITGLQGTGYHARIVYHDGTAYKQSAWVEISSLAANFLFSYSYLLHNHGDGNVDLYILRSTSQRQGPPSLYGQTPIASITDGPTTVAASGNTVIAWTSSNSSASYTADFDRLYPSSVRVLIDN